ncbi:MAG: TolC family protein [Thiomicrorhabdus chilensis]|uniref:TolC family protein n=1 Tax=Thiomicrorhabdus chilensis TaxID=63656 RepID=UPI00299E8086|nr:TolC family protein [Thiomicrorhabdus chilensis]MDX1348405.1 TolC family protein [Thiomicrorhabdus chilensis]
MKRLKRFSQNAEHLNAGSQGRHRYRVNVFKAGLLLSLLHMSPLQAQPSVETHSALAPAGLKAVLQAVITKQPEQFEVQNYTALAASHQKVSQSWLPNGMNMMVRHENDALTDDTGFQSWETGVSFPVAIGDQANAYAQLGEVYQQQSIHYPQLLNLQASALTRQLVWELKMAEVEWQRSQQNLGLVAALASKVESLVKAGDSPKMDLVLVQKERVQAEKASLEAQNQYQQKLANYQFWTGFSQLPNHIQEVQAPDWMDAQNQLESHPQVVWAQSQLQQVQARKQLAETQSVEKPNLFVGAKSEQDDQTSARTSLMLEMSFPLGKPASYSAQIADQNLAVSEAQVRLQKTKQQILNQARQAHQSLIQSQQLADLARQQVGLSQQALSMAEKAYEMGETNIQTLLQVQTQMLKALLDSERQQVLVQQNLALYWQALGQGIGQTASARTS